MHSLVKAYQVRAHENKQQAKEMLKTTTRIRKYQINKKGKDVIVAPTRPDEDKLV